MQTSLSIEREERDLELEQLMNLRSELEHFRKRGMKMEDEMEKMKEQVSQKRWRVL